MRSRATTRSPSSAPSSTSRAAAATATTSSTTPSPGAASACSTGTSSTAGFLCIRCHSTQGARRRGAAEGSRTYPSMDQCLLCHNNEYETVGGQVATAECDLCHTKQDYGAVPASHETPTGSTTTDPSASSPPAAPATWRRTRAPSATTASRCRTTRRGSRSTARRSTRRGRQACGQCHDTEEYCVTCHQVEMPHPEGYVGQHPKAAERVGTAHLLQLPSGRQLPGVPRGAQRRRPARPPVVRGRQVHAAGDARGVGHSRHDRGG